MVTWRLEIPTIGIGAGPDCDGQVLVYNDLLGYHSNLQPRFVKRYADFGTLARNALSTFATEVRDGRFPSVEHCYELSEEELQSARAISLTDPALLARRGTALNSGRACAGRTGPA